MAKSVADTKLSTRNARLQLAPRGKPYYRELEQGLHLGYRRLARSAGRWVARVYVGGGRYRVVTLANADDYESAPDNADIERTRALSFKHAQELARRVAERIARDPDVDAKSASNDADRDRGPFTVAKAIRAYLEAKEMEGKDVSDSRLRADGLIIPKLGSVEVNKLTAARIRRWHKALADEAPRMRTRKGEQQRYRDVSLDDTEVQRQRRSTANRTLTVLKAALNFAWRENHVENPTEWQRVQPFQNVDAPRVRYLKDDEIRRLLNACEPDMRDLVLGALHSGARYGELRAMRVDEFDPTGSSVYVHRAKSGKARSIFLTAEATDFFVRRCAGQRGNALIFTKSDGTPWGKSQQTRRLREACAASKIRPAASFHILRHTYGSRALNNGVDLKVVAENLGHSDTRTTERHYGHLADAYRKRQLRERIPELGMNEPGNITQLTQPV